MPLEFNLDEHQSRVFRMVRPGVVCTFPLGRGTGKTFTARSLIHCGALDVPGSHIGLILPSLKQARQVFWPALLDDFEGPLRGVLRGPPNRTELTATYRNGSRLTTWGTENAGAIRGQRFRRIIQDETDLIDPATEHAVITPTFSRAGMNFEHAKFGTPLRGRYGSLYGSFSLIGKEPGFDGFRLRSEESPQVDQAWLARVKATTPPDIFRREYECDFDSGEGLVYDLFDEDFHVRAPHPEQRWNEILVGVDWGYAHAGAMIVIGVIGNGDDAQAHVIEEVYTPGKVLDWWVSAAQDIQRRHPRARFFCDPSQPASIETLSGAIGKWVEAGDNKHDQGIARVATMLMRLGEEPTQWARLYVSPTCTNVIREFKTYRRRKDPSRDDRYLDAVEKRDDDAMDAIRYALLSRFGAPPNIRHEWTAASFG